MPGLGGRLVHAVAIGVVVAVAGACSGTPTATQAPSPTGTAVPAPATPTTVSPSTGSPAPATSQATQLIPSATPSATSASRLIDPGLLALLPPMAGGFPIEELPEIEAQLAANELVGLLADGVAVGRVADPDGAVMVITIIRLTGIAQGDAWFASYRENYDRSACESVGGLGSSAPTTFAGLPVDRTSCLGGATIFHLRVRDDTVVISILAVGPTAIVEEIVANLRP